MQRKNHFLAVLHSARPCQDELPCSVQMQMLDARKGVKIPANGAGAHSRKGFRSSPFRAGQRECGRRSGVRWRTWEDRLFPALSTRNTVAQ
jgi:hypothetical protein